MIEQPAPGDVIDQAQAAIGELTGRLTDWAIVRHSEKAPGYQGDEWLQELEDGRWQQCSIPERAKTGDETRRGKILSPTVGAMESWFWMVANWKVERYPRPLPTARDGHKDFVEWDGELGPRSPDYIATTFGQAVEVLGLTDVPYVIAELGDVIPDGFTGWGVRRNREHDFSVVEVEAGNEVEFLRIEKPHMVGKGEEYSRWEILEILLQKMMNRPSFRDRV